MQNDNLIICQPTIKNDRKLKKICEPLLIGFGIDIFWYYTISDKGELSYISNHPQLSEFFYCNELYKGHPYFKNPKLLKSGFFFNENSTSKEYSQTQGRMRDVVDMDKIFMVMNVEHTKVEGYGFAVTKTNLGITNSAINNLYSLKKFINYFHSEAEDAIKQTRKCSMDLSRECLEDFLRPTRYFDDLVLTDGVEAFLKRIDPIQFEMMNSLTMREKECLKWLVKGLTAVQIGKKIHLSNRTVESYIVNIKNKLGCRKKQELFDVLLNHRDFLNLHFF